MAGPRHLAQRAATLLNPRGSQASSQHHQVSTLGGDIVDQNQQNQQNTSLQNQLSYPNTNDGNHNYDPEHEQA